MRALMERAQQGLEIAFADETRSFEDRVVTGLDALMGPYVGSEVARDLGELLENSEPQLGSMFGDYQDKAKRTLSAQIDRLAPAGVLTEELSADSVTDVLFSATLTWKQTAATRSEFRDRVRRAVRLLTRTSG